MNSVQRVYLITEVYVASALIMNVKVGDNRYQWNSSSMIPVGFVFRKCDVSSQGVLTYGPEVGEQRIH